MAFDKNKHLDCVLKSHNIENNETLMISYRAKRDEVREDLKLKFGNEIYRVIHSGSYKKKTAVNVKFDMDLVIPFKKATADTLANIYSDLFNYFNTEYRKKDLTLLEVKKQKVAIGLIFLVDGEMLDLDIVPGREIDVYEEDGNLNVYVNDVMGLVPKSSYIKTNIQKQIDSIRNNGTARETIKLLKVWKRRNNGQIKSMVIELITVKALNEYSGNLDKWSMLKYTMEYIRDNIQTVRLIDPGNSNNVVSDSLDESQKVAISDSMNYMLERIDKSENSITTYFPVNETYPCEDEKRSVYIVSSSTIPDKLNDEDFG